MKAQLISASTVLGQHQGAARTITGFCSQHWQLQGPDRNSFKGPIPSPSPAQPQLHTSFISCLYWKQGLQEQMGHQKQPVAICDVTKWGILGCCWVAENIKREGWRSIFRKTGWQGKAVRRPSVERWERSCSLPSRWTYIPASFCVDQGKTDLVIPQKEQIYLKLSILVVTEWNRGYKQNTIFLAL